MATQELKVRIRLDWDSLIADLERAAEVLRQKRDEEE